MEIIGTGLDLVENARIARSIAKFGDRFLHRIFAAGEIAYCKPMREPAPHYAARFAAKEAVAKAFGCGIGEWIGFLDIEVVRDSSGAPSVTLHGPGRELAVSRGVTQIFLSLSHTEHYATASALLVKT
jgi:holo-[acyl-carrier protein] synthase